MSQPIAPFYNPEVILLEVPQIRRYWAYLLRNCVDKYAQEHPLYALFSSVLSTLSKITCAPKMGASPSTADGTFLFSYPQCRVVNKTAVGREEYAPMSVYPDLGLLRSTITELSNGQIVQLERIKLLVEVKRLYKGDEDDGWFWTDRENIDSSSALEMTISSNLRQLLLQAYCTFEAYGDSEVYIMFIVGIYFTLFKFNRPEDFKPLPQDPRPKRQKFGTGDSSTGKPKWKAAKHISDSQLAKLIPPECISVFYPQAPVFVNARDWDLQLSDAFRLALNDRLNEVEFQPCSLFDVQGAQYTPSVEYSVVVEQEIADWYAIAKSKAPKTPEKVESKAPYYESPIGIKESPETPGYKGRALGIGTRQSLPRVAKRGFVVDFFASEGRRRDDGGPGVGEPSGAGNVGGGLREGEDATDSGDEGRCKKGKRKAADM